MNNKISSQLKDYIINENNNSLNTNIIIINIYNFLKEKINNIKYSKTYHLKKNNIIITLIICYFVI